MTMQLVISSVAKIAVLAGALSHPAPDHIPLSYHINSHMWYVVGYCKPLQCGDIGQKIIHYRFPRMGRWAQNDGRIRRCYHYDPPPAKTFAEAYAFSDMRHAP